MNSGWLHGGLRVLALLWTLLITALIGNVMASNVNAASSATKAINFTMFVAAWSWVACLVGLAAIIVAALAIPWLLFPLDILAVLLTFISAIVLSAKLTAVDCGNYGNQPRSWIAFGSNDTEKRCREIQASTVFMWFLWATLIGCLFFTFKQASGLLGGRSFGRSKPGMSQVRGV
ncbi:putative non-classical export protein Nce102 [Emericellopsis atlantica]|uniref:Non-classical export protein Nce102 n=1 Tax=Emericellopsis atlantica TaxID=2614577 RepID=A0A9P7ZMW2_9HYPO|nr:putative non-classical export protein Nce102 [Emericellopsis atlantica]KAG9254601.1 putative non-classical export protein Nce102 [Emericellopsis atlantica]